MGTRKWTSVLHYTMVHIMAHCFESERWIKNGSTSDPLNAEITCAFKQSTPCPYATSASAKKKKWVKQLRRTKGDASRTLSRVIGLISWRTWPAPRLLPRSTVTTETQRWGRQRGEPGRLLWNLGAFVPSRRQRVILPRRNARSQLCVSLLIAVCRPCCVRGRAESAGWIRRVKRVQQPAIVCSLALAR